MMKKCTTCKTEKQATPEFFYRNKGTSDGLSHRCKECLSAYGKKWRQDNRKKRNAQRRHRRQIDTMYKLQCNMRSGFSRVLSKRSRNKSCRTFDYIGMTPEGFWQYLESQFQPGMTRENHGMHGWHVDHIRPVSSFDFEGDNLEAALHECWHYTNLQPLWAKDNIRKGAKWDG